MKRPLNPYIAGIPIESERGFFGRKDIITKVQNELSNQGTNVILCFGQRRIGKTSLLKQLKRYLLQDDLFLIYFDLMDRARMMLGEVLYELSLTMVKELEDIGIHNFTSVVNIEDNDGLSFANHFIPEVLSKIQDRRIIFLFDEFDVLDTNPDGLPEKLASRSLYEFIRKLMSSFLTLGFVFASGRDPDDLSQNYSATFKSSILIPIGVLDDASARQLVLQAELDGTLKFSEEAIIRILSLTGNHPYFTQLICQRLWERFYSGKAIDEIPDVFEKDIDDALIEDTLSTGGMAIRWLWDGLSPAEKVYASALAEVSEMNGPLQDKQVKQVLSAYEARLSTRQVVSLAPRDLVKRGILIDSGKDKYQFANQLLYRWIRKERPLDVVKDQLDRLDNYAYHQVEIGKDLLRKRRLDGAKNAFEKAIEQDPSHLSAHLNLGETLIELAQFDDAIRILKSAYHLSPEDSIPILVRALVLSSEEKNQNKEFILALNFCEEALQILPGYLPAQELRVKILRNIGDKATEDKNWTEAIDAYKKAGLDSNVQSVLAQEAESLKELSFTFNRHIDIFGEANHIAFSPDCWFVVSDRECKDILVWGLATGTLMKAISNLNCSVENLSFVPKSSIIAISCFDSIHFIDIFMGIQLELKIDFPEVKKIVFSPDAKYLCLISSKVINILNFNTKECLATTNLQKVKINSAEFTQDNKLLAIASDDKKVLLWDFSLDEKNKELNGHIGEVVLLSASLQRKLLASVDRNNNVTIWRTENWDSIYKWQVDSQINKLLFIGKEPFIAMLDSNSKLLINNFVSGENMIPKKTKFEKIKDFTVSSDGKLLAIMNNDGIDLFNLDYK